MRYLALCSDYDGTLAEQGKVLEETITVLEKLRATGRKLLLVTGRELEDLKKVFSRLDLFDYIVAENGALLYRPQSEEEKLLADKPPQRFIEALQARGVSPISVGRVIVATWEPHEQVVLDTIRDMGLELQVIFNKGAVMILPAGVNKATGLNAALEILNLSPHNAIAVGDAENDHAFLNFCECGVAVANALPGLMAAADFVTANDHGRGVIELVEELLENDLSQRQSKLIRHQLPIGRDKNGEILTCQPYDENLLIVGTSGSGKSTVATSILECLAERKYSYCVIDPEGDYEGIDGAVTLGTSDHVPTTDEILQAISKLRTNTVVNLIGLPFADRPAFFQNILPRIRALREQIGRPHWLIVDETHHVLPAEADLSGEKCFDSGASTLMISVHPEMISRRVLKNVDTVIAIGKQPEMTLKAFGDVIGDPSPAIAPVTLETGEVLVWKLREKTPPICIKVNPSHIEHRRHIRKYSEGELPEDRSFYFRGPQGKLNLRAQNLIVFLQMADGVDDETWHYHLQRHDVSDWIKDMIKDPGLSEEVWEIEQTNADEPEISRLAIRKAIEKNYTLPGKAPSRSANA